MNGAIGQKDDICGRHKVDTWYRRHSAWHTVVLRSGRICDWRVYRYCDYDKAGNAFFGKGRRSSVADQLLAALRIKGRRFVAKTAAATFMLSGWLYVIPAVDMAQQDFLLASVFGGVISGAGMGLVLLARATTGGTDMVAVLIQRKLRHYSVVQVLEAVDGLIVLLGIFVFGLKSGMYAMIAIFIASKVSDALMEGMKYSKAAFIITERYDEVAGELMEQLDRGVTGLNAKGMYSGGEKCMLYCVVSKKEIVALKEIVVGIDRHAFVIVSDAREVLGEGFIEHDVK